MVSDGYFAAAGVPLRSGRTFTEGDRSSSERVVVVNETLARTLWPGQNPLGQSVATDGGRRVVGVVADVRHTAWKWRAARRCTCRCGRPGTTGPCN
ncbi:MAG: ABC transporter permease [Ignavibacteriota bacterium]